MCIRDRCIITQSQLLCTAVVKQVARIVVIVRGIIILNSKPFRRQLVLYNTNVRPYRQLFSVITAHNESAYAFFMLPSFRIKSRTAKRSFACNSIVPEDVYKRQVYGCAVTTEKLVF